MRRVSLQKPRIPFPDSRPLDKLGDAGETLLYAPRIVTLIKRAYDS